jgi:hippurate hydrolase
MIEDGLMDRWGIEQVFGMHNMPGMAVGTFAIREGGIMAATDDFKVEIEGRGGHAARPQATIDPVMISTQIIVALQTLVSRNVDPLRSAVLSTTVFKAGEATNIIPRTAYFAGTIRTLDEAVRTQMEERLRTLVTTMAEAYGAKASITIKRGYPVTVNSRAETDFAVEVAGEVVGSDRVDPRVDPTMGAEDFSFMLQARPGAYIFIGNGESSELHTDTYDFNDDVIPVGVSYWARLVEKALVAG